MSIVYITQIPHKRHPTTQQLVPSFNVSPAAAYGDIKVLMPHHHPFITTAEQLIPQLRLALAEYSHVQGDSLLPIGDPIVSACAIAILAEGGAPFNVLRWDRILCKYILVPITL